MSQRLDANETVYFERQLEVIDERTFDQEYAELKARRFLPNVPGLYPEMETYTYRQWDKVAKAKRIANHAHDFPRVEVFGKEFSHTFEDYGLSFGYTVKEIKRSARTGQPLDALRASACRRGTEEAIDEVLAIGDTVAGLQGILTLSDVTPVTVSTKIHGSTEWGSLGNPLATGKEMAHDLMAWATEAAKRTEYRFGKFVIVIPDEQYEYVSQTNYGNATDVTALRYALANCKYIEAVEDWHRLDGAGAAVPGTTDRALVYARDERVTGALVAQEYTQDAPQLLNRAYTVNASMTCGGVVCRYPVAVNYRDGL